VRGWVKTLIVLLLVVANRSPVLLKARLSTKVEVPFLNVADAEAEAVMGPLKIEMLPPKAPTATLPAESTAKAETSLAVARDRVAVGVDPASGSANWRAWPVVPAVYKCCVAGGGPGGTGILVDPPHAARHAMKAAMSRKSSR
jgi:hypothetical protein